MFTSTCVSCFFTRREYTQHESLQVMSHPHDVGDSRHIDRPPLTYILRLGFAHRPSRRTEKRMQASSSVSALTECARTSNEDAHVRQIKFNAAVPDPRPAAALIVEYG